MSSEARATQDGALTPSSVYRPRHLAAFLAIVAASAFLALEAIHSNFVMVDEFAHVPAGMSYWQVGRFSLYRENPPLVQCLVALPPLISGAKVDYTNAGGGRSEWNVGRDFLIANAAENRDIFRRARCVVLFLGIACGALIFWWAGANYGGGAAVVCAALWLLDPSVLAFSGVCTADVGSATFGTLATYAFWRSLERPNRPRMLLAGLGLGLALASKFNMLVLYPAWIIVAIISRIRSGTTSGVVPWGRVISRMLLIGALGLFVLNSLYLFEGSFTPLGSYAFKSHALSGEETRGVDSPPRGNRFRATALAGFPTPLPRNYLLGLDSQKWEAEVGLEDFQQGSLTRGGHWYGPLVTLAYKLPLGTLLLLIAAGLYSFVVARRLDLPELMLWIPASFLLLTLCSQVGLNWPIRYALSALPFLMISAGAFVAPALGHRLGRLFIASCLLFNGVELLKVRPHFLSYANEIAGGPAGAQGLFHGSNYDWGQDLYRFKIWYDEHPTFRPMTLSYYGPIAPDFVGVPVRELPASLLSGNSVSPSKKATTDPPHPFYWAISSNTLNGMTDHFPSDDGFVYKGRIRSAYLKRENAFARVGYTIYLFRIGGPDPWSPEQRFLSIQDLAGCIQVENEEVGIDASP